MDTILEDTMITQRMNDGICEQINREFFSAYLYLGMSNHANSLGLKGFAHWFMVQYHEEMVHTMRLYEYVQRQGGKPVLKEISCPQQEFTTPLEMFEKTLEHERFITQSINDLIETAKEEKDNATQIFLHWFITEQVEEENNDVDIINQLRFVNGDPRAILLLDKDLGARVLGVPTDFSNGVETALVAAGII